jgi:uncharacterized protein
MEIMEKKHVHGQLAHFAINVDDIDRANEFYAALFGWKLEPWGPPGFFIISTEDGAKQDILASVQGRRELVKDLRMTGPECTFAVDDIDAAISAIRTKGGTILMEKTTLPGIGQLIFFQDTEGNVLGAMQYED